MCMAGYQRAECPHPVDVLPPSIVPDVATLAAHECGRVPSHRPVRAHRAVDATREELERLRDHAALPFMPPSRERISCRGRCTQVRIGVSRTVERRLSVPRRSRTRLPKATRSSVSYATRKSWSSMPNEYARSWRTCWYSCPTRICSFMIPWRAAWPSRYHSAVLVNGYTTR